MSIESCAAYRPKIFVRTVWYERDLSYGEGSNIPVDNYLLHFRVKFLHDEAFKKWEWGAFGFAHQDACVWHTHCFSVVEREKCHSSGGRRGNNFTFISCSSSKTVCFHLWMHWKRILFANSLGTWRNVRYSCGEGTSEKTGGQGLRWKTTRQRIVRRKKGIKIGRLQIHEPTKLLHTRIRHAYTRSVFYVFCFANTSEYQKKIPRWRRGKVIYDLNFLLNKYICWKK